MAEPNSVYQSHQDGLIITAVVMTVIACEYFQRSVLKTVG